MKELKDVKLVKDNKCYLFVSSYNNELRVPFRNGYKVMDWYRHDEPKDMYFKGVKTFIEKIGYRLNNMCNGINPGTKVYELDMEEDVDKIKMIEELMK